MRSVGLFAAGLIAAAAGVGCGGGSGPGLGTGLVSCTVSESVGGDGGISLMVCQEVSGSAQAAQMLQQGCVGPGTGGLPDAGITAGAHFANGPCSHVGALGACQLISMGATVNAWYYDDGSGLQTSATVQALCSQVGATFIPP